MSNSELAYAAGILDGEGCISIVKQRNNKSKNGLPYYEVRVTVHMASEEITKWFQALFGGAVLYQPRAKPHWKDQWRWTVSAGRAERCLTLVFPYLKEKRAQAQFALTCRDTMWGPGGNKANVLIPEMAGIREALFRKVRDLKKTQSQNA